MATWLVKGDPDDYSAADLERERRTVWTGVRNPVAQKNLRSMNEGDDVLVYHTGDEKAIVATATVAAGPRPDPAHKSGKLFVVDLAFGKWFKTPVTLATIKADPAFASFDLVRISRLSVMPVSEEYAARLHKLSGGQNAKRP
jgi:predicted RNA-binding protein with PUA-like domain